MTKKSPISDISKIQQRASLLELRAMQAQQKGNLVKAKDLKVEAMHLSVKMDQLNQDLKK
ncbi:hypothetical protein [Solibacillus sp. FSL W7-1324]|uniref:hypothetical protein n=1 Tax=Solibacillus sp. FSL W7-1324 TaxID=2921701 RepID=UPI0030FA5D59